MSTELESDKYSRTYSKHCLDCGYIIDHLPENRCPECGRRFDLTDSGSYSVHIAASGIWNSGRTYLLLSIAGGLLSWRALHEVPWVLLVGLLIQGFVLSAGSIVLWRRRSRYPSLIVLAFFLAAYSIFDLIIVPKLY